MKPFNLEPLANRVVIRPNDPEEKIGRIHLPSAAQTDKAQGKVIAVGPGLLGEDMEFIPINVNVGDEVLFSAYGGTEITWDGEDLKICCETEIMAVIHPEPANEAQKTV